MVVSIRDRQSRDLGSIPPCVRLTFIASLFSIFFLLEKLIFFQNSLPWKCTYVDSLHGTGTSFFGIITNLYVIVTVGNAVTWPLLLDFCYLTFVTWPLFQAREQRKAEQEHNPNYLKGDVKVITWGGIVSQWCICRALEIHMAHQNVLFRILTMYLKLDINLSCSVHKAFYIMCLK